MKEQQVDILSYPETRYNWNKTLINRSIYQLRKVHNAVRLSTSNVDDGMAGAAQKGGTMTAALGGVTGCVVQEQSDKLGRWSTLVLRGK